MKALIVDDEKHVRQAIRLLADWKSTGILHVLEAENGEEAVAIIASEQPQIIITDMMMPVKNGLELMVWIQAHAPRSKIIVISGHKDYEFLRHAVKYGSIDYLLKPIDPSQLQDAIVKAETAWKSEHRESLLSLNRNQEINQLRPLYLNQSLSELIDNPQTIQSADETIYREFISLKKIDACCAAILSLDFIPRPLLDRFASSRHLLEYALLNICNEWLASGRHGIAFKHQYRNNEIVMLLWDEPRQNEKRARDIHECIWQTYKARVAFGIGRLRPFPHELKQSYQEACDLLSNRNLRERQWMHVHDGTSSPIALKLHFIDWEEKIRLAVKYGGADKIRSVVEEWLDAVARSESITAKHLLQWEKETEIVLTRLTGELHEINQARSAFSRISLQDLTLIDDDGKLTTDPWKAELLQRLGDLSTRFREARAHGSSIVHDIVRYIRTNYSRELTLQEISEQFFLSREYISRKFKQEFNENIVDFLSRIRIESAKALLANPKLKIVEISQAVGYQDEKYFSKVFKKFEGVSPNEFRKQRFE